MRRFIMMCVLALALGACGGGSSPTVSDQVAPATDSAVEAESADSAGSSAIEEVEAETTTTAPAETTTTEADATTTEAETTTTVAETTTTTAPEVVRSSDFCEGFGALRQLSLNFPPEDRSKTDKVAEFTLEQTALYEAIEPPADIAADFTTLQQTYISFNAALEAAGWDIEVANPLDPKYFGDEAVRSAGASVSSYFDSSC